MSFLQTHIPCDDCGSSDGRAINEDGWSHCFVCQTRKKADNTGSNVVNAVAKFEPKEKVNYRSIPSRNISAETCRTYGCVTEGSNYIFQYRDHVGALVAEKIKTPDKSFSISGEWKQASLYGQHLFKKGGKFVTIVEGEMDALAAYQMLGSKWAVVSIRNGAASALKDCKKEYEWLDSFESIVICFDNDEAGQRATNEVAELFGGKARVMRHRPTINNIPIKDACDYLVDNLGKEFSDAWWGADQFVPDGIIQGNTLFDLVMKPIESSDVMYPFEGLNKLTYGIRLGELVTITAGSGLGKSQFVREIVWHILQKTEDSIGLLFLEESTRRTGLSIMSLAANKPLHLPDCEATDEEKLEAYEKTLGTSRLYLFDHFGSTSVDNIINRVRYLAKGLGCKYIFLDHISIVVSAQGAGDERKALDEIMTRLRMLVQETGIALLLVSHLRRPDGKGHEEGTATSLSQLRGSGAIAQLSDMVLGLERNGQADDPKVRNTTHVRVLKNRFSGLTGKACDLLYDLRTGRMTEHALEDSL
jgi:twinkle protein